MNNPFVIDFQNLPASPLQPPEGWGSAGGSGFSLIAGGPNRDNLTVEFTDGQYQVEFPMRNFESFGAKLEVQDYERILNQLSIGAVVSSGTRGRDATIKIRCAPDTQPVSIIGAFAAFDSEMLVKSAAAGPF